MRTRTRIIITGVSTLAILGIGTAGAVAMTNTLGVAEQTGQVQKIDSVKTGSDDGSTTSPTPTPSTSTDPTGTSTVVPAAPVYIDDHGGDRPDGVSDDGPNHDLGDDHGGSGSGSSGSGSDDSGSGHGGSGGHGSDD